MKHSTAKRHHDAIQAIDTIERLTAGIDYEANASGEMAMAGVAAWIAAKPRRSPLTALIELARILVDKRSNWQARIAGLLNHQQKEGANPDQQIVENQRRPGYA